MVTTFEASKRALIEELKTDPDMQAAIAAQFRRDFEEDLNQSHDFLQLVKLVRGYAVALLHEKYPELAPEDAADRLPAEGSIYFSTLLMTMKVDALLFLEEINRAVGNESKFEIHRMLVKYVRIYNWQAKQKQISLGIEGACHATVFYNDQAIGAVVQGLLDNLVKYAPAGSSAAIKFTETERHVAIDFTSLGPKIEKDETSQIFLPRFRARAARKVESTGQGIGLATVRQVSDLLGLEVRVEQSEQEDHKYKARFVTKFSIRLDKA